MSHPDSTARAPGTWRAWFDGLHSELGHYAACLDRPFASGTAQEAVFYQAFANTLRIQDFDAFEPSELDDFLDYHRSKPCGALHRRNASSHPQRFFGYRNQLQGRND